MLLCSTTALLYLSSTKTSFQLPPMLQYSACPLMAYMYCQLPRINAITVCITNNCTVSYNSYSTVPLQCLHQDCIPSQNRFHSLPGLGPRPYTRRPKHTNRPEALGSVTICVWSAQELSSFCYPAAKYSLIVP